MLRHKCPCKECTTETGRSMLCHAECEKYISWKAEREERLREEFIVKESRANLINHKINTMDCVKKYGQASHLTKAYEYRNRRNRGC